ncbi:prolyl oligopeptidase family serine peptidase [Arthrobacter sp. CG_A4]|uniref:prolyl oligopeptidase family serine peptidase n=1 Tax=Arthrobacter sp. CG_A4 TaxID=3071706 RepID=UPI002DFFA8FF|nr:hypothetical protein [Arthrobacter sp. CG_A4]
MAVNSPDPGMLPGAGLHRYFRNRLQHWDKTPRQGIPQIAGSIAVHLWRGPADDFAALYTVPEAQLREAWDVQTGAGGQTPLGTRIPAPPNTVVRGFSLSPDGHRIAALLSPPHSELAQLWLLAPDAQPIPVPGVHGWHGEPVWAATESSVFVLTGKPPLQGILRCPVPAFGAGARPDVPDAVGPEALDFPAELTSERSGIAGHRLSLRSRGGRLQLLARTPGAGVRLWELNGTEWQRLDADPPVNPVPPHGRILAAAEAPGGTVLAVEHDGGTRLTLAGRPLLKLSAAEQLAALAVTRHSGGAALWVETASPERPSGVVSIPLPPHVAGPHGTVREPAGARFVHLRLLATASDGVDIPLLISARAQDLDARNRPLRPRPLILSCYGGFGVSHRTEPEPSVPAWLESGGIYVAAQLRGGGELGKAWHEAGRGVNKQRTMLDLIDAANSLAQQGWTKPEILVAVGASHGGLVVATSALMAPATFGAVIAVAPVLDTVHLDRHGLGPQWHHEFGADGECPDTVRAAYSPLHLLARMETAAHLPPLLCCVMGKDERVDNSAAIEFVDGIRQRGGRAWLYQENNSGHSHRAATDVLEFSATVLAFAATPRRDFPALSPAAATWHGYALRPQ